MIVRFLYAPYLVTTKIILFQVSPATIACDIISMLARPTTYYSFSAEYLVYPSSMFVYDVIIRETTLVPTYVFIAKFTVFRDLMQVIKNYGTVIWLNAIRIFFLI